MMIIARVKEMCNFLRITYQRVLSTAPGKHPTEKALWITVHVVAIAAFAFMIFDTTENYRNTPTATRMATDAFPTSEINFPAVGICNVNLISKRKAIAFVEGLLQKERIKSMNLTKTRLLELVKYVGHLYTFSIQEERPGDIDLFQKILESAYDDNKPRLSILAESVGVQCEHYIVRCQWAGIVRMCSDILEPRFTSDGHCCAFNYARWRDHFSSVQDDNFIAPVLKSEIAGWDFGLSLLLDANAEDYFYQLLPMVGFKVPSPMKINSETVIIYGSTDFPDPPSGSAREVLVATGTETFLNIGAYVFDTKKNVENIDASKRICRFKTEMENRFGGRYSFSDCIMDCRVRDIVEKCGCIPFFNPRPNGLDNIAQCSHGNLKCLNRYQTRWWGMNPISEKDGSYPPGAFSEIREGHLNCDCKPTCDNINYIVSASIGNLRNEVIVWDIDENALNRTADHAVLNVYFGNPVAMKLEHDVQYYWYELMSNYGALCSVFLGLSIMSGIQMIYKFSRNLLGRHKKIEGVSTTVKPANEKLISVISEKNPQIYWQEIDTGNGSLPSTDLNYHFRHKLSRR